MLASIQLNRIDRSLDGGANFDLLTSIPGGGAWGGLFVTSLDASDKAPDVVYTAVASGVDRTRYFSTSWESIPIQSNWGAWVACKVRASNPDPHVVWAGCGLYNSDTGPRLHVSHDQGDTFSVTGPAMAGLAAPFGEARRPIDGILRRSGAGRVSDATCQNGSWR